MLGPVLSGSVIDPATLARWASEDAVVAGSLYHDSEWLACIEGMDIREAMVLTAEIAHLRNAELMFVRESVE